MRHPFQLYAYVELRTGITEEQIRGKCREQRLSRIRSLIVYALRREGWCYRDIGGVVGIDHSSAIAAYRRAEAALYEEPQGKAARFVEGLRLQMEVFV